MRRTKNHRRVHTFCTSRVEHVYVVSTSPYNMGKGVGMQVLVIFFFSWWKKTMT
jgi:hypothetical protein